MRMDILEQQTYLQPDGKSRITLRRLKTPFYPTTDLFPSASGITLISVLAYSCERLVDGEVQEGCYGIEKQWAEKYMKDWSEFEKKIGSRKL